MEKILREQDDGRKTRKAVQAKDASFPAEKRLWIIAQ
jgi:hypothetical protein